MPETQTSVLKIRGNVIFTLLTREMQTRFGRYRLGYLWAILEPLSFIVILSFIRARFGDKDIAGVPYVAFFAAGVLPYFLFNHIINVSLFAVEANLGLLNYQRVKPFDMVVSRILLEVMIFLVTGTFLFAGIRLIGIEFQWNDPIGLFLTLSVSVLFFTGLGFIVSMIGPLWHESKKLIPILMRPLFFISGVFFAADTIPEPYRSYLLINPLLHVCELTRFNVFKGYTGHGNLSYLTIWALCWLFLGLCVYRLFRIKVVTSGSIR